MLPSSALYGRAIANPHRRTVRVTAFTPGGEQLTDPLDVLGGSVTARLASRVTRSASFTLSPEWFPTNPTDPLSPAHAIVRIEAGLSYPDGQEELFKIFRGRVYSASLAANGQVTFRADDLAADVIAADFERPTNSQPGRSTVAEIRRLILLGFPWATFGTDDVTDAVVPKLTWDDDRGRALDDLASSVEGRWFTLGDGSFVTRRYAYEDFTPVTELTDGEGGTLSGATSTVTADGAYNSVVVLSERLDGNPIRIIERNLNTLSPYRFGGDFGYRVAKVRLQTALAFSDAQRVARNTLAASTALTRQWSVSCVPDYRLEPGDVIGVSWRGVSDVQIIDSLTWPLGVRSSMSIQGRSSLLDV
jgi:Domain of unknown function (DUF5047)/Putative phage tail protein